MKRILSVLTILLVIGVTLCGCNNGDSSSEEMKFEQLEWPTYENALQIPVPKSTLADVRNSNDVRFEFYLSNTTMEDYKEYVEECKEKGFTENSTEQEHRYYAFNEAKYKLTVEYLDGDIMYICVVEERFDIDIKLIHVDKESVDAYNLRVKIDDMWEEDSEKGDEAISLTSDLREGTHTLTIENDDNDDVNGRIDFTVSGDGEYFEFEIECLSSEIIINQINGKDVQEPNDKISSTDTMTLSEAKSIFDDVFDGYDLLVDDVSELLDYCDQTTFTSIDKIHEYEQEWVDLSDTAYELANALISQTPPEECKIEWEDFGDKLMEIGSILFSASVMDGNLDNKYDSEEMAGVINAASDKFVAVGEEIIDIATRFNAITEGVASSSSNDITSSNSKKCEECGKSATKTVDLFGQKEYYCMTHYNEIMEIIDMMESDVGNGSASRHTCEECSSEGTHSIVGFSGKTEYYCTKHYNELKEFLEILQ